MTHAHSPRPLTGTWRKQPEQRGRGSKTYLHGEKCAVCSGALAGIRGNRVWWGVLWREEATWEALQRSQIEGEGRGGGLQGQGLVSFPPKPSFPSSSGSNYKAYLGPPHLLQALSSCPAHLPRSALGPGTVPFKFLLLPSTSKLTSLVHLTLGAVGNGALNSVNSCIQKACHGFCPRNSLATENILVNKTNINPGPFGACILESEETITIQCSYLLPCRFWSSRFDGGGGCDSNKCCPRVSVLSLTVRLKSERELPETE